jgi:hypothetical protein
MFKIEYDIFCYISSTKLAMASSRIPLHFTETVKKGEVITTRYYKVYYDYFDKCIKCGIIGNKLTEEETKKLSQFGKIQFNDYLIKLPFLAQMRATLLFDSTKFINFIVHYSTNPSLIFSVHNEYDANDQYNAIIQLFNEQERDIIHTTLKNANRSNKN